MALPADGTITLPIFDNVLGDNSVIGSIVGTRNDLVDVFALPAPARHQGPPSIVCPTEDNDATSEWENRELENTNRVGSTLGRPGTSGPP